MAILSGYGNVGRDGELKFIPSGTAVLTFSVAISHGWGDKATTSWYEFEVWGKFAEAIADRVKKGCKVSFSGESWLDNWEGQDGRKGTTARVKVIEINIQGESQSAPGGYQEPEPPYQNSTGDTVPF